MAAFFFKATQKPLDLETNFTLSILLYRRNFNNFRSSQYLPNYALQALINTERSLHKACVSFVLF